MPDLATSRRAVNLSQKMSCDWRSCAVQVAKLGGEREHFANKLEHGSDLDPCINLYRPIQSDVALQPQCQHSGKEIAVVIEYPGRNAQRQAPDQLEAKVTPPMKCTCLL